MNSLVKIHSGIHQFDLQGKHQYLEGSKDIDYAYYMKGMNYFNQISDVQRDQSISYVALKSFNEVINRFSESDYAIDAAEKVKVINDRLAGKELNIALQYQNDHQWESKYFDNGQTQHIIPPRITNKQMEEVNILGLKAHKLLKCRGVKV